MFVFDTNFAWAGIFRVMSYSNNSSSPSISPSKNFLIAYLGGISGTITDTRLIFSIGLQSLASSIIIAHNHPSGNKEPSEADNRITNKIKEAGSYLDIQVLDHIILTQENYYSYSDNGNL